LLLVKVAFRKKLYASIEDLQNERLEGLLPRMVAAALAFTIRKPAVATFSLEDYVTAVVVIPEQAKSSDSLPRNASMCPSPARCPGLVMARAIG
jgi:hypothetical protein